MALAPAALADAESRFALGHEAAAWTNAALRDVPARALVLTQSDDLSAGTLYAQAVWGLRPDATVLVRQELWDATYLARAVARGGGVALSREAVAAWRSRPEPARIRDEARLMESLLRSNLHARTVMWESGDDRPPDGALVAGVPLDRLSPTPEPLPPVRSLIDRIAALLGDPRDALARRLEAHAISELGAAFASAGDVARASALFETALRVRPEDAAAAVNLAVMQARQGRPAEALALVERVLAREPDRLAARLNAGKWRALTGDLDGAEREFRLARRSAPDAAGPRVGLARVAQARGDLPRARKLADEALAIAPEDAEARSLVEDLRRR
jgi:tetratricopeptide (TPR) repeat protein